MDALKRKLLANGKLLLDADHSSRRYYKSFEALEESADVNGRYVAWMITSKGQRQRVGVRVRATCYRAYSDKLFAETVCRHYPGMRQNVNPLKRDILDGTLRAVARCQVALEGFGGLLEVVPHYVAVCSRHEGTDIWRFVESRRDATAADFYAFENAYQQDTTEFLKKYYPKVASRGSLDGKPMTGLALKRGDPEVTVSAVKNGSPAARLGLQRGDVLRFANGERVRNLDSLIRLMERKKPAVFGGTISVLSVTRDYKTLYFMIGH